ncbi:MAG TPA: hypothetical protein VFA11_14450 [Acidimicrobiales bacterium]|nr:hypothetical protein [Acidimicrobiales bacterium]
MTVLIDLGEARALLALAATAGPELAVPGVARHGDQWTAQVPPCDDTRPQPGAATALIEQLVRGACRNAVLLDTPRIDGYSQGRPILATAAIAADLNDSQATHLSRAIAGAAQLDHALLARGLTGGESRASIRSAQTVLRPWQSTSFEDLPIAGLLDTAARLIPGCHATLVAVFADLFRRRLLLANQVAPGVAAVPNPRRLQRLLAPDAGGAPDGYT